MQHLRNPESMVETMRFSSRVDISEPNSIAKAEAEAKTNGITLGKLNDSNPTKHALAPEFLPLLIFVFQKFYLRFLFFHLGKHIP